MYLLQALGNPLRQTVFKIRPVISCFEQIKIFVPMGLYMDQNLNLLKKACFQSKYEKRFCAMDSGEPGEGTSSSYIIPEGT